MLTSYVYRPFGGGTEFSDDEGFELFLSELVSFAAAAAAVTEVVMTVAPMPCRRASTLQNLGPDSIENVFSYSLLKLR